MAPEIARTGGTAPADTPEARQKAFAAVAQEFEAMLLLEVVRQMREPIAGAEGGESMFHGGALLDTIDAELARQLSQHGGIGLARALGTAPPSVAPATRPNVNATAPERMTAAAATNPGGGDLVRPDLRVSSRYGWRLDPFTQTTRFHAGLDMAGKIGDPVPAASEGRVVFAGRQRGYGLTVVLEHEPGVRTRYAHLSEIDVRVDEVVSGGASVGRVGSTGRSTAPHLHFEVMHGGRSVDPLLATRAYSSVTRKVT